MTKNIQTAITLGLKCFKAKKILYGSDWADANFYLSPESSGVEKPWKCYPYQRAILNWMTCDDIEEVNVKKSKRLGYSKCVLATMGSFIEQKRRNIALWQPTDSDAKDFAIDEVDTMLRDVPVVGSLLKCKVGAKSKYNTNEKKVFHGATLDIKGGKSPRNFRRMTKDVAIYEETDGFDLDIGGEGSCFDLGDGRLDQSPFPKSIRGSTPGLKGKSLIDEAVKSSEMIMYRFVKCPQCGTMQRLQFANLKWDSRDHLSAKYVCVGKGCYIYYKDYSYMDENGRWETLDGYYYDEESDTFFNPDDERIDKPISIGVVLWAAYSYLRPWSYIAYKWIRATDKSKKGDNTSLIAAVNTILGETYEDKGESVDSSTLENRGENYHPDVSIPNEILFITFGADVQGGKDPRIEVEILGYGLEDETWSIDYLVFRGAIEQQDIWDHLDDLSMKKFKRHDGVELRVSGGFIDSGYLPSQVYKFTGPKRNRNIFATKGVITGTLCNPGTWQGDQKKGRAILHTVNTDEAKTIIFNRLNNIITPGPGYCHFPNSYNEKYFEQLTNEEKKEKMKKGRIVGYEWVALGRNEPLDCRVYNMGAFAKINPNLPRIKMRLDAEAERIRAGLPGLPKTKGRRVRSKGLR